MNLSAEPTFQQALPTAEWTSSMRPSMLYRFSRLFGSNPDIISFAGGAPDPDLFPTSALAEAAATVISSDNRALQYGRDLPALKEQIVALMAGRGISCDPDNISITAGGQHAMDILTRLFLNPGGQVMLEELVYTGIQQTVMPFRPEILAIPMDPKAGLDVEAVSRHLAAGARPAFLYTIPEAHNPAGVTLSEEKRQQLAALARQYNFPIVEDDAYGFLNYEDEERRPLASLDQDHVVYLGTFSKILAPGLRLGWIASPPSLTQTIHVLKQLSMLSVVPLSQYVVAAYLSSNSLWSHMEEIRYEYGRRRDVMLAAMVAHFPPEVTWVKPQGGMFIWARLPEGLDAEAIVYEAVEREAVGYIPGKAFVTDPNNRNYDNYMRLSFTRYGPERITEGIARLGRVLGSVIARQRTPVTHPRGQ